MIFFMLEEVPLFFMHSYMRKTVDCSKKRSRSFQLQAKKGIPCTCSLVPPLSKQKRNKR